MVTFRLIEETDQYLTCWYFPNGNEDEMYGILLNFIYNFRLFA